MSKRNKKREKEENTKPREQEWKPMYKREERTIALRRHRKVWVKGRPVEFLAGFVTSLTTNRPGRKLPRRQRETPANRWKGGGVHVALRLPAGQCHTDQGNCPMELPLCVSPRGLSAAFTNFAARTRIHRIVLVSTIILELWGARKTFCPVPIVLLFLHRTRNAAKIPTSTTLCSDAVIPSSSLPSFNIYITSYTGCSRVYRVSNLKST